ncbi:MAG: hypothetical protein A6F70_06190 [Cycloclasticus sp. symbiont of Bathymodiolus heckerae]|nr:MAG: hypothetical protein A6F70_06190 [Cycloclasticus sp. symbiont of Bathymodiolus heckerae]
MRSLITFTLVVFLSACSQPVDKSLLQASSFNYPKATKTTCPSDKTGISGNSEDNKTSAGATYNLRTPSNYDPSVAHPLIVVFAPAGTSARKSERHVHLTKEATEAGFIIAFAKNKRLSLRALKQLSSIPNDIKNKWCINPERIYYTGHSDGGTITNALTFLPSSEAKPTAIAPSAAGMDSNSLKQYSCPKPLPVMVFHNKDDSHFEGFGKQAADWWAQCNQCSDELSPPDSNGCRSYNNCSANAQTYYCESPGSHSDWPNKNNRLITFFNATL